MEKEFKDDNKRNYYKIVDKYKKNIICPHCRGIRINRFGKQNNKQRYICRDKTFIIKKIVEKRYSDEFKLEVIKLYLERMGIRSIERIKRVHNTVILILQWIRKFAYIIKNMVIKYTSNIRGNNIKII